MYFVSLEDVFQAFSPFALWLWSEILLRKHKLPSTRLAFTHKLIHNDMHTHQHYTANADAWRPDDNLTSGGSSRTWPAIGGWCGGGWFSLVGCSDSGGAYLIIHTDIARYCTSSNGWVCVFHNTHKPESTHSCSSLKTTPAGWHVRLANIWCTKKHSEASCELLL